MAEPFLLTTTGLATNAQAFTNSCYVHPTDLAHLATIAAMDPAVAMEKGILCAVNEGVFFVRAFENITPGQIGVGMHQRMAGAMGVKAPVPVTPFRPPTSNFPLSSITIEIDLLKAPEGNVNIEASELAAVIKSSFNRHVFKLNQMFAIAFSDTVMLKATVREFEYLEVPGSGGAGSAGGGGGGGGSALFTGRFGQIISATEVNLRKAPGAATLKITGSAGKGSGSRLFERGFNFAALGIGGLTNEFQEIFRRAFASRVVPPDILRKMGQKHVRGMLLYGPPGCGKTLIARQIGKALHARPPKVVNGPEILNKYVGASEENIRNLFTDAEKEQAEKGDDSELHIIIFDEFDAIVRQRGTVGGGTGVHDSIVNQLLSKIDGVDSLNNILIIGMTNRKDLIDEAILRPGRLEVHVEIGLPDEAGRVEILNIHTASLRTNNMLAADVSLEELAARTKNYTGAELEGVVKAACSYVFSRQVDFADLSKVRDFTGVQVTMEDFERALADVQPAFGVKESELTQCLSNGIISYGPEFERLDVTMKRLVQQVHSSDKSPLVSVLLCGGPGTGKSALAAHVALESRFPFVKRISGESLLSQGTEGGKIDAIVRVFTDAYKSPLSMIILDDIERIIEFVPLGSRFSNALLQTLLVLVKTPPPPGHRLFIVGTTAVRETLEAMELLNVFQLPLDVPKLTTVEHFIPILQQAGGMSAADAASAAEQLAGKPLGIKKLLMMIEMARQDEDSSSATSSTAAHGAGVGASAAGAGSATPSVATPAPLTYAKFLETMYEWNF